MFQRSSPTDALLFLVLMVTVLYRPYVLLAVIHDKFLGQRKVRLFENLLFGIVEVQASEGAVAGRLKR